MSVAIVLGAGGPAGHAFHAGALAAISSEVAWEARDAALLVGTSAGAQVAALLRAGMSAMDLAGRVLGAPLTPQGETIARAFVRPDYSRPPPALVRRRWMASPGLFHRLFQQGHFGIGLAGLLPEGTVDLSEQAERLRDHFGAGWPDRSLWINAVCLSTGRRVTFGHPSGPSVDVGTAVASSGAIPSVCRPIHAEGRRFVDGGFASLTSLDLVEGHDFGLVIVSSPLSCYPVIRQRVRSQVRRLERAGSRVLLLEPTRDTRRAIGFNVMSLSRAPSVCESAMSAVAAHLRTRSVAELLGPLRR